MGTSSQPSASIDHDDNEHVSTTRKYWPLIFYMVVVALYTICDILIKIYKNGFQQRFFTEAGSSMLSNFCCLSLLACLMATIKQKFVVPILVICSACSMSLNLSSNMNDPTYGSQPLITSTTTSTPLPA